MESLSDPTNTLWPFPFTPQDWVQTPLAVQAVSDHRSTKGAQTAPKWSVKPTVPTSQWERQSSRRSGSPDHLGGLEEEQWGDRDPEGLGGLEVDDEIELH